MLAASRRETRTGLAGVMVCVVLLSVAGSGCSGGSSVLKVRETRMETAQERVTA